MDQITNSDVTMCASTTFDNILHNIQASCLNLNMLVTPFSAVISLKKTFIKDRSGSCILPPKSQDEQEVMQLKAENSQLKSNLEKITTDFMETNIRLVNALETIKELEEVVQSRDTAIENLEIVNKNARDSALTLNKMVNHNRVKYEEEKLALFKEHKCEVKMWRKELGEATRNHVNLQRKFDQLCADNENSSLKPNSQALVYEAVPPEPEPRSSSDVFCSICSDHIPKFIPEYFWGDKINPACQKCNIDYEPSDPYSSFPSSEMPISLVSHWFVPPEVSNTNLGSICTLRSHYVILPNPGDTLVTAEEVLAEFKAFLDEQRREYRESCKQS